MEEKKKKDTKFFRKALSHFSANRDACDPKSSITKMPRCVHCNAHLTALLTFVSIYVKYNQ